MPDPIHQFEIHAIVPIPSYSDAWRPTVPIDGDPPYRGGDPACGRRERHRWVILRPT